MNRREIAEIRRRFQPDKSAISLIRGCYVNEKREIVSVFNRPLMSFPQEEAEKYLALFGACCPARREEPRGDDVPPRSGDGRRGAPPAQRDAQHGAQGRRGRGGVFQKVIDALELDGNYLILLTHDAYDLPTARRTN